MLFTPVSDPQQVKDAVTQVEKDFGRIDVFVANAGEPPRPHAGGTLPNPS